MIGSLSPHLQLALLLGLPTLIGPVACSAQTTVPNPRPNVVLVLVDDMGYSDLGCYGGEIATPVLDSLANRGLRFARFYNSAQCTPSRASLLTGLYPHQAGLGDMNARGPSNPFWKKVGSPAYLGFKKPHQGVATLPEILRSRGYQTYMSGKWHLGDTADNWPSARGFERTFSLIPGAHEHFTGRHAWQEKGPIALHILDGEKIEKLPQNYYSTDTFTDYALRFIEEGDAEKPFFLYLAYTAPHWPFQAHPSDAAKYDEIYQQHPEALRRARFERMKTIGLVPESAVLPPLDPAITAEGIEDNRDYQDRSTRHYAGMIECIDRNLGRLVNQLKQRGEFENTLFLFMSDNGADTVRGPLWGSVSNAPFRRYKIWTYDGGIATPLTVHWPAGVPDTQNGKIIHGYAHFIDILPTVLAAASVEYPAALASHPLTPPEGIDLLPAIRGESSLPADRPLYWERLGNEAIRLGDWKLVRGYNQGKPDGNVRGNAPRSGSWELYNVAADPGETRDLIDLHPEKADSLRTRWQTWADRIGVIDREAILNIE